MSRYEQIVFLDGDNATEALAILDEGGTPALLEHLQKWHMGGHETSCHVGPGTDDDATLYRDGYILAVNRPQGYVSLEFDTRLNNLDAFETAYLECALWASHALIEGQEEYEPLDDHKGIEDLSPETIRQSIEDCFNFRELTGWDENEDIEPVFGHLDKDGHGGHDFFLTREGHGAGFWDGDWPSEVETFLTESAKSFGEHDWHGDNFIESA